MYNCKLAVFGEGGGGLEVDKTVLDLTRILGSEAETMSSKTLNTTPSLAIYTDILCMSLRSD